MTRLPRLLSSVFPALRSLGAAGCLLALTGCGSRLYELSVESSHQPGTGVDLDNKSYLVRSVTDTSTIEGTRLHKEEAARLIAEGLAVRGMYQAPDAEHANVLLDLQYGMGPAKIEVKELNNPSMGHYRRRVADEVREKHLTITARDPKPRADGQPPDMVWTVHVRNRDDADALRKYLPILAEVAADWASKNTHGVRSFTATIENGVLIYVSGGYEQPGISPFLEK